MKCTEVQELIIDLTPLSGERPSNAALEQHLQECVSCRRVAERYSSALYELAGERQLTNDPFFYDRIIKKMNDGQSVAVRKLWSSKEYYQLGRALAGFAAAVLLGIWLGSRVIAPLVTTPAVKENYSAEKQESYEQEIDYGSEALARLEYYFFDDANQEKK